MTPLDAAFVHAAPDGTLRSGGVREGLERLAGAGDGVGEVDKAVGAVRDGQQNQCQDWYFRHRRQWRSVEF